MAVMIEENAIVLFQGDSITDAGRSRENKDDLGVGYAMMVSSWFSALYPEKRVKFINRGVSGDRVRNLKARWKTHCIDLKPTWVSIMVGINDTWRRYDSNDPTSPDEFENDYREILIRVKNETKAKLILIEPFVLPVSADRIQYREDLDPKIKVVRKLAKEFNTLLLPLDGICKKACTIREPSYWGPDGVHPSLEGHALIAQNWLKLIEKK